MIPKIVNNPLDNFELNLPPETTQATLSQYYPQLNQSWEAASQEVTTDGIIVSRTFSVLSFPNYESKLVKVDLGIYDPEWEANFYYQVLSYFDEASYTSHYRQPLSFNEWKKQTTKFRSQTLYKHKEINKLEWSRPTLSLPETLPVIYSELALDYTLTINVGKALGATVSIVSPVEVRLKSSASDSGELVNKDFVLLTQPILEIKFKNITLTSHTQLTVSFYGEYYYLSYTPANQFEQEDELTLIHPFNTSYSNRLKPPGLPSVPDNFWNSNYSNLPSVTLANRTNPPQWMT
jgi:hypothetical protein